VNGRSLGRASGYAFVVGATSFALAFGDSVSELTAYVLAFAFGVVVFHHADRYGSLATYLGAIAGFFGGVVLSEAVATALVVWYLAAPVDAAAWLMGVRLLFGWFAFAVSTLTGFFLAGLGRAIG